MMLVAAPARSAGDGYGRTSADDGRPAVNVPAADRHGHNARPTAADDDDCRTRKPARN